MRVLLTNNGLARRSGTELYVRDLALELLRRGHTPIAYSTQLGPVAEELRAATVAVVDDLDRIAEPPDLIHGQHHLETMTALLRFPGVPAVYVCHGWLPWEETPPRFPRIRRCVAVDDTCRDRLTLEHGIPPERVRVLLNWVDLERFQPRGPLPPHPRRALVFSNYASGETHLDAIRAACGRVGIGVDVIGQASGRECARPEALIGQYDLVFAKARAALEALAVGSAVVPCDRGGVGQMVTTGNVEELRRLNFGIRALREPPHPEILLREIARYDPEDAARVSRRIRKTAGLDESVSQIVELYEEVAAEFRAGAREDRDLEARCAADYLRFLSPRSSCSTERPASSPRRDRTGRRSSAGNSAGRLSSAARPRSPRSPAARGSASCAGGWHPRPNTSAGGTAASGPRCVSLSLTRSAWPVDCCAGAAERLLSSNFSRHITRDAGERE